MLTRPDIWLGVVAWTPCRGLCWVFITQWVTGTALVLPEPPTQCKKPNSLRPGEGYGPSIPRFLRAVRPRNLHSTLGTNRAPCLSPRTLQVLRICPSTACCIFACVYALWIWRQKVGLYLWLNVELKHSRNAFPSPTPHPGPFLAYIDTIDF